jgi:signal transduction histidine kinase
LTELLNNACKFTPSGEKIVVQAQTVEMLNPTSVPKIQISVSNWGVEIPASKLTRIFEKFYRISSHDFWNQGGTGLGLALVQQLVVHLGGKVSVESSAHQTCFSVELPLN